MKFVKKLTALFLAVVMTMAMGITVFAEGETTAATYTISAKSDDTHTYKVYQIFTGSLSEGVLSDIVAGKNYNGTSAAADAEKIAALSSKGQALADAISAYVDFESDAYGTVKAGSSLTNVPAGYYLIKDEGADDMTGDSYSTYIVEVVDDVTITPKKSVPSFEKKIKDKNDTTDADYGTWQDSADHDMGDAVPFKLEGKVASNYDSYKTYYFAFHDVEETGLTFNSDSVKVYIDGAEISTGYQLVTNPTDGCTFEVVFSNLKSTAAKAGSTITVEYTSTLNENANLGSQGNVNKAKLEYSNNPNNSQGGEKDDHGETPWDNVIVFTYKVVVNKYANSVADGNKLTGAEFTLSKKLQDGTTKDITVVKSEDGTSFEFKGLDDGTYVLTETKTPAGYNSIDPITFTVDASHNITWDGTNRTAVLTSLTGTAASGEITFTANDDKSALSTNVVNKSGSTLPETGGMGTTVIYIAGIAMIVAAGVVVIARKRMA